MNHQTEVRYCVSQYDHVNKRWVIVRLDHACYVNSTLILDDPHPPRNLLRDLRRQRVLEPVNALSVKVVDYFRNVSLPFGILQVLNRRTREPLLQIDFRPALRHIRQGGK